MTAFMKITPQDYTVWLCEISFDALENVYPHLSLSSGIRLVAWINNKKENTSVEIRFEENEKMNRGDKAIGILIPANPNSFNELLSTGMILHLTTTNWENIATAIFIKSLKRKIDFF